MSGGHFEYGVHHIQGIEESIKDLISNNIPDSEEKDEYGDLIHTKYSRDTIQKFKEAVKYLELAYIYAHRIDYLVSGDDSEKSFHERFEEDLDKREKT